LNAKCGLGSFRNARRFSSHGMNLRKYLEIHPNPIVEVGSPVSRVEMNAKGAPLTPACPHRRLSTRFSRPRAVKIALTKPTQSYTANVCPFFIQLVWSLRISASIFVSRLASRSRRFRISPIGNERRNTSSACWEAWSKSTRPLKPARGCRDEGLGWGAKCLGLARAIRNSRSRSVRATST